MGFRQQILMTLLLMPLTFGIWYAAGALLAQPAAWLAGFLLTQGLPSMVSDTLSQESLFVVVTAFGEVDGVIVDAVEGGFELALQLDTRLVSYSIPFYSSLLWASRIERPMERFAQGIVALWFLMALGLAAMAAKDLMLVIGDPFLDAPAAPPSPLIALGYQFSVLLMPTLAPVIIWVLQLRGSALWEQLEARLAPG